MTWNHREWSGHGSGVEAAGEGREEQREGVREKEGQGGLRVLVVTRAAFKVGKVGWTLGDRAWQSPQ